MVKISKEMFVNTIRKIQAGNEKISKASSALETIIDGYACINIADDYENALLALLEDVMDDKNDWISWWLYENVRKKIWLSPHSKFNATDKKIEIDVSTPEFLYDYLEKYC